MVIQTIRLFAGKSNPKKQINLYKAIPRLHLPSSYRQLPRPWFGDSEPLAVLPQVRPDVDGWLPAAHRLLEEIELGYIIISKLVGYTAGNSTWQWRCSFAWLLNQGFSINILLNSQKGLLHRTINLIQLTFGLSCPSLFKVMTTQVAPPCTEWRGGWLYFTTPGALDVEVIES